MPASSGSWTGVVSGCRSRQARTTRRRRRPGPCRWTSDLSTTSGRHTRMRAEIELYKGPRRAYYGSLSITMLLTDALRERLKEAEFNSDTLATTRRTRVVL